MAMVICPVCKRQNEESAVRCGNCGWELRSGIFLGGPNQEEYERLLREAQVAWAKREAAPELERDVFETEDEHRLRLEALGAVIAGTGTLVREGYDIQSGYFLLKVEWKDWIKNLAPQTTKLHIIAERDLAKRLWAGGPAYPVMANFSTKAGLAYLAKIQFQTQHGNLDIEGAPRYTKISNAGRMLYRTAKLGTAPDDWGCTLDTKTGLMWEIKTTDGGLRDMNHTYTWYDPNLKTNGGNAGSKNGGKCTGSRCDTRGFVEAVNAVGLCGFKNWRMPTIDELKTLERKKSESSTINTEFFPNSIASSFWSASANAFNSASAWDVNFYDGNLFPSSNVNFYDGNLFPSSKGAGSYSVRLVRGGQ